MTSSSRNHAPLAMRALSRRRFIGAGLGGVILTAACAGQPAAPTPPAAAAPTQAPSAPTLAPTPTAVQAGTATPASTVTPAATATRALTATPVATVQPVQTSTRVPPRLTPATEAATSTSGGSLTNVAGPATPGNAGTPDTEYLWKSITAPTMLQTEEPAQIGSFGIGVNENDLWEHQAVWTGQDMFVWGGGGGARYNPSTDHWSKVSLTGAPKGRKNILLVWTGKEILVWSDGKGGRYDPATDSWKAMSSTGAPGGLYDGRAIWTGKEMIVWGGGPGGEAYNPVTDSWRPLSTRGAPLWAYWTFGSSVVWTGKEMIVWGGLNNNPFGSAPARYVQEGERYNPETDTWSPMSSAGAPKPRKDQVAVWTGREMLVMGGLVSRTDPNSLYSDAIYADDGGRYDPSTDTWSPIPATKLLPTYGYLLQLDAVWTGHEAIMWGGYWPYKSAAFITGQNYELVQARFNPQSSNWTPLAGVGAPIIPVFDPLSRAVVWDGKEILVFGSVRVDSQDKKILKYTYKGAKYAPSGGS